MTEKFCAGKDYFLKENVSGKESCECKFRFQIGKDKLNFIFDVTDPDIISPYSSDNENIYYGDAVEIFITPDGDLGRYKELEVSPFGVRFFGNIINRDGKTPELTKIAPAFSAQAMETLTGYRVVIDLPFESAGIRDLKKAKFNAYRLDKKADGKLLLYALNPTMCESFHRPAYFVELNEH